MKRGVLAERDERNCSVERGPWCLLFLSVLLAIGLTSCGKSGGAAQPAAPEDAGSDAIPVVPVSQVVRNDMSQDLTLTGEFQPYQEVDVMAKVAGYVKEIRVDSGDRVSEGELLATLEVPEMEDDRSRASAATQAAAATVAAARDELQRATAEHDMAELSFTRIRDVNKQEPGLVPRQDVDVIQSRDLEAADQLAAAQSHLEAAEQEKNMMAAEQQHVETLFKYTKITAPFAGVITKRYASKGSMIQAGTASQTQAEPVVRLSQNNLLRLILPVPESAVPQIHDGETVEVTVRSLGKTFPGRITRFADTVQTSTRTMDTEVDVHNSDLLLVPGMYAEVVLHAEQHANALCVPVDAVEGTGDSARAYTVNSLGIVHIVPVKIGIQTPQQTEILSGLIEGQTVIVGGHSTLQENERVRPKPETFEGPGPKRQAG
jgi:RND family efflux transporter MFP subunit